MRQRCHVSHQWDIQLRLAYNWAMPAILEAGKGRGGCFNFFCFFAFIFLSPLSLSFISFLSPPFLWEMTQNDPQELTCH